MRTIQIPLTQGLFATVDEADAHLVKPMKWHAVQATRTFYAATRKGTKTIYMHRLVMGIADRGRDLCVDHIDFDGTNNTRSNLQLCSLRENARKARTRRLEIGAKGVWQASKNTWVSRIVCDGRDHFLGTFDSQRDAAIAYNAAATVLFGKFAVRNFQ